MESKRLEAVAKRMSELAVENGSFNIRDGVQLIAEKDEQGNDGLRVVFEDGYDDEYASSKSLVEVLEKMENPDEAFWMIHPERNSMILVENECDEIDYYVTGSFYVNSSAEQDLEQELSEFLDFLENNRWHEAGWFKTLQEDGVEVEEKGVNITRTMDTPAVIHGYDYNIESLYFINADPYNSGDRNVCEEIENLVGAIGIDELDEETIKRINNFYPGDIRNFEPEQSNEPEYDDDYDR